VQDPFAAWLWPGPAAPEVVAAALARASLPPAASDHPPAWLRADQRLSFARALAAVRRYGGALLADGVGTGKTFIGLAVAAALEPGGAIQVMAPAALLTQWREAAVRLELEIRLHSHETLSRGRPPGAEAGPVLIDESHRFRTPSTRRYETLAPWCVGRRGLLLSATPLVNRLEDLSHQLLLLVRDDALSWAGVASLRTQCSGAPAGALAELVVTGEDRSCLLPRTSRRVFQTEEPEGAWFDRMRAGILDLALSTDPAIAGLLRGVLYAALASSPLALAEVLGRYAALLQHARDAEAGGRRLSRQAIRRIIGTDMDQLVLWPLIAEPAQAPELALDDLRPVRSLESGAREWASQPDAKCFMLRQCIADQKPTLVFAQSTATVRFLRHQLGRRVAWCTGQACGLDGLRLPRDTVLDWFRKPARCADQAPLRPRLLVATDVAAEGLDLPLIQRVVHYDLPWTAVRLEQRSGRALRLGARHAEVEVIRFLPPARLEAHLHQEAVLEQKARLPDHLGLGDAATAPWRLRAKLAAQWLPLQAGEGVAVVSANCSGLVAGFRLVMSDGSTREAVRARIASGWSDDTAVIAQLLECARGDARVRPVAPHSIRGAMRSVAGLVRKGLQSSQGQRLLPGAHSVAQRRALRRLMALAREAARGRNQAQLAALERGLAVLRRGHTAGEARRVEHWIGLDADGLLASLGQLPPEPARTQPARIELIGVLVVECGQRLR
jgi:superfamily II DNA or RNA helicase